LVWGVLKPQTKLRLAFHVGKDGTQAATFICKIKQVNGGQSSFFVSDGQSYSNL